MARKKEVPMMIVASTTKSQIKEHGDVNVSGDFVEALSREVDQLLAAAVRRCLANKRKTVRPDDL